jgi:Bacterial regulatory proteins, luxR family
MRDRGFGDQECSGQVDFKDSFPLVRIDVLNGCGRAGDAGIVSAGRSDPQIGMILDLSSNTVHAHVEAAKTKLAANSRAQLVLRAVMAGILRSDPSR